MKEKLTLGIFGASSLETDALLDGISSLESFEASTIRVFGNRGSVGRRLACGEHRVVVEESSRAHMRQCDALFVASPPPDSLVEKLTQEGVFCIDMVGWREGKCETPLVPWVNGLGVSAAALLQRPLVSIPDPVVALCSSVLNGFISEYGLQSVSLTTCESLSGVGKAGLDLLREESQGFFQIEDLSNKSSAIFARSMAFNVVPCAWETKGGTGADEALALSLTHILGQDALPIHVQRLRVPTFVGTCVSLVVGLGREASLDEANAILTATLGDTLRDGKGCSPREVQGSDTVHVTVRNTPTVPNGLALWVVSDNLRLQTRNALACVDLALRNGIMSALKQKRKDA